MIRRPGTSAPRNQRGTTTRQRRHQHLLDVKVRSRKANAQRNRKLLAWFSGLILCLSAAGALIYGTREALRHFLWENKDYAIKDIHIETDGALTRDEILRASGIGTGQNIFTINLSKARQSLLNVSQIEAAEITRTLPDNITINISERKPAAWLARSGAEDPSASEGSFLVDRRGVLIAGKHHRPQDLHLPVIYGVPIDSCEPGDALNTPEVKAALDLLRLNAENTTRFQVRSIDLSKGYCMVVTDRNHAQITFGLDQLDWQLDRLATLLDHVEHTKQELQTVNLMVVRNVPITFAPLPVETVEPESEDGAALPPKVQPSRKPEPIVRRAEAASAPKAKLNPLKPFKPAPAVKKKPSASTRNHG